VFRHKCFSLLLTPSCLHPRPPSVRTAKSVPATMASDARNPSKKI
jgi:hypothetical protein